MIEVQNLVKQYGDHIAVNDLSFTVEKGKIYGFLGPNGAGKSTTMNIITGYLAPTSGHVIINGHDILNEPEAAKKCIGYLPEIPPLYTDMTVREYLEFAAQLKKLPKSDIRGAVDMSVEMAHLEDVEYRLIANLSKGYRQRVGLAQAVLGLPEIIILDEPTVGLDPKQIIEIRDLIKQLSENHTVILSSHILSEVQEICDHVLIIHHGKLVASGTPQQLEEALGSVSMDLTIKSNDERAVKDLLSDIQGISDIKITSAAGEVNAELKLERGADIRENVFYKCAQADLPLLMMKTSELSLESIFLQLTNNLENDDEDPVSSDIETNDSNEQEVTEE